MRRRGFAEQHRIVYLQPCHRLGGAERQAAAAIARLVHAGLEVVPLIGPTPLLCRWLEPQGVRGTIVARAFSRTVAAPGPWRRLRARLRGLQHLAEQVEAIVRGGAIDLVVAGSPDAWVPASRAARRLGIPVVWRSDGTSAGALSGAALRLWAALAPPDLLVYDSQAARHADGPVLGAPAMVLPAGVDVESFRPGRGDPRPLRPSGSSLVIGFAGRLAPPARPEEFVRLAAVVAARHPQRDITFLMAGDGPLRQRCEAAARAAGLGRSLRLLGFVADMPGFYAACDIVIHPSSAPGCGSSLLEAMAAERPVVAAECPATLERMAPGREGLVCPAGDREAFAEAVGTLIGLPQVRVALARAARARMTGDFDARRLATRLGRVLEHVVATRGASMPPEDTFASDSSMLDSAQ